MAPMGPFARSRYTLFFQSRWRKLAQVAWTGHSTMYTKRGDSHSGSIGPVDRRTRWQLVTSPGRSCRPNATWLNGGHRKTGENRRKHTGGFVVPNWSRSIRKRELAYVRRLLIVRARRTERANDVPREALFHEVAERTDKRQRHLRRTR